MTEGATVSVSRAGPWLLAHVDGLEPPLRFTRVGDGQSNLTFRVDDRSGRAVVLRRPPLGETLESAHDMEREHHVLTGLAGAGMPVPRPLALCDELSVIGARFYVMEHVEGLVLSRREHVEQLPTTGRAAAGVSLARTLAHLQTVDLDASGLANLRRSAPYAQRQLRRWRRQWEASRTRDLPLIDELAERLAGGLPEEREVTLIHGDYRLDNAVVGPDGAVRAVLDWELCTVGDPLADLGLLAAYWSELGAPAGKPAGMFPEPVTTLEGFPGVEQLVNEYVRASGRDVSALGPWVAFAYWKIAIIAEGVYRRWLDRPVEGSRGPAVRHAVPRLAQLAAQAADQAEI